MISRSLKSVVCSLVFIIGIVFSQSVLAVTFSKSDYVVDAGPFSITSGDFNQDGSPDLAATSTGVRSVSVMLNRNDLSGTFNTRENYNIGSGPRSVATADFNRDGAPDLAVANFFDNTFSVLLNKNDLTGAFIADNVYSVPSGPSSITSADFNGDGAADLAVANRDSNNVSVLINLNNGDGVFAFKSDYPVGQMPLQVTSGDFNGDGAPDLAVVSSQSDFVSVFINRNNLTGLFDARTDYPTGSTPISVTTSDFNGDGAPDLAVGNNDSDTVSVFLNKDDLTGTFNTPVDYIVGGNPFSITTGDFDGDGANDLAIVSTRRNLLSVLPNKNDMSGTFIARTDFVVNGTPISITSGDYNGDGDIDLATSNFDGSNVTVLLNTTGREPDFYDFTDIGDVELNALVRSDTIVITGLDNGVPISVAGGEYSINSGSFTSVEGTIFSNDRLQVRTVSSAEYGISTDVVVTIASVSALFTVTTINDTTPDDYTFVDQANVALNTSITSDAVVITGLGASAVIGVTGGEYSINNGDFTAMDGFINNGDTVTVRHTSSPIAQSTVDTVLTIGGVSGTFSTTTTTAASDTSSAGGGGSLDLALLFWSLFIIRIMRDSARN